MPATLIETKAAGSTAATNTITVTLAAAPAAGDKLIAFVGHTDDFPAVPTGWTQNFAHSGSGVLKVMSKTADGTEGTVVLSSTEPHVGSNNRWSDDSSLITLNGINNS